jgi:hypothetical protein
MLSEQFKQLQIPGVPTHKGEFERSEFFARGAERFGKMAGRPHNPDLAYGSNDPNVSTEMGNVVRRQQGVPHQYDPELAKSYEHLTREVSAQFDFLTKPEAEGGMGVKVNFVNEAEPYETTWGMARSADSSRTLNIAATLASSGPGDEPVFDHPYMNAVQNDQFRAVHDAFGHVATGRNFQRTGEEGAARMHAQMFSPEARPALMSESRLQNSYYAVANDFPENKPYSAPKWASEAVPKLPKQRKAKNTTEQLQLPL